MSDRNSQDLKGEEPGGYVAIYHEIEEMNYGPRLGMPAKWRVFLCIRHKLLRDGLCEKHIGTAFIMEHTGLTKSQIKTAIKALHTEGLVVSTQNIKEQANGTLVYGENSYSLNPVVFGNIYNWYKNNPTMRLYSKDKTGSYSKFGKLSTDDEELSTQTGTPVSDVEPGGVSDVEPGGVSDVEPGRKLKLSELYDKIQAKNPSYKNPKEKNPSSENSFSGNEKRQRTQQEHLSMIRDQLALAKAGKL